MGVRMSVLPAGHLGSRTHHRLSRPHAAPDHSSAPRDATAVSPRPGVVAGHDLKRFIGCTLCAPDPGPAKQERERECV